VDAFEPRRWEVTSEESSEWTIAGVDISQKSARSHFLPFGAGMLFFSTLFFYLIFGGVSNFFIFVFVFFLFLYLYLCLYLHLYLVI
jgi:hypothetical protein